MCCPRKKKRHAVALTLRKPDEVPRSVVQPRSSDPPPSDPPPSDPPPMLVAEVIAKCGATQPRIHIKCSSCNKDVVGVEVTLGGIALGPTGADGKTKPLPGGMIPGKGDVALVPTSRARHKLAGPLEVTYPKLCQDTFLIDANCVSSILVEVLRYDGVAVAGGAVKFVLDGPGGKQDFTTAAFNGRDDQLARDVVDERKEITDLAAGNYTITLAGVPALITAQKSTPTASEVWTMGPDPNGVAKLELAPGDSPRVRFTLTKIQKVQFIGLQIEPTDKADKRSTRLPSKKMYHGNADADVDIGDRSVILKNAIKQAVAHSDVKTEAEVLKVFMAPEFYWRGKDGAYPIEKLSHIMDLMREEIAKPAYKDWLFVHGTAIGYLKHGDAAPTKRELAISGASGTAVTSFTVVDRVGSKDRVDVCARIPANWDLSLLTAVPQYRWTLVQGSKTADVVKCTKAGAGYTVDVAAAIDFADGPVDLLEPAATEMFNVALVQKGGPGTGVAGVREAIVYKEDLSAIDYLGVMFGKHDAFHKSSGDNRTIEVHGETRRGLPTEGSRDVLGGNPNAPDNNAESTEHGLGGGSIFEIDGITFGLEICRDHLQHKLKNYFVGDSTKKPAIAASARPGESKVQVQLIPSWGAHIDSGGIVGVDNVLVFNVDGPDGASAGAMNGAVEYECPDHLGAKTTAPGKCPNSHFTCWGLDHKPGPCPHCAKPRTRTVKDEFCLGPAHQFESDLTCPHCGKPTTHVVWRCTACKVDAPTGGPCTEVACVTKPARVEIRECTVVPHVHATSIACGGPRGDGHYCSPHKPTQAAGGPCPTCGLALRAIDVLLQAKKITPATASAPTAVVDGPGTYTKITESEVTDLSSPTKKRIEYKTANISSTPKQTDYFKKAGTLVVYPPMDVPPAAIV